MRCGSKSGRVGPYEEKGGRGSTEGKEFLGQQPPNECLEHGLSCDDEKARRSVGFLAVVAKSG